MHVAEIRSVGSCRILRDSQIHFPLLFIVSGLVYLCIVGEQIECYRVGEDVRMDRTVVKYFMCLIKQFLHRLCARATCGLIRRDYNPTDTCEPAQGRSAIASTIVEQFGFAMMPWCSGMSFELISGTTRGTCGSMRKADELSITRAPAATAAGANCLLLEPPAEKKAISTP